jgi:hypothetical protein
VTTETPPPVLPCIVCGGELERADPMGRQPVGAVTFKGSGGWASEFDRLDYGDQSFAVNICDGCLRSAGQAGRVNLLTYPATLPEPTVQAWTPEDPLTEAAAPSPEAGGR